MNLKINTLVLLLCCYCFAFSNNDIYFHKISVEQGLSQFSVITIYQDEFGSLWFGTREGVNKYNGNSIEVILPTLTNSKIPENIILNICGDHQGHVYIQSQNGVNEYNLHTSTIRSIIQNSVNAIAYGSHNLWIAENNILFSYKDGTKKEYSRIESIGSPICSITETSDENIYLGTISSGVYIINKKKEVIQILPNASQVSSIFEDSKKNKWIATCEEGVYKIDTNQSITNYRANSAVPEQSISSNYVRAICEDNKETIWIGSDKGLDKLIPTSDSFTHYNAEKNTSLFLSNESVWALTKDSYGTIWIGTYFGGVNYFNPEANFYTYHDLQNGSFLNKPFPIISNIIRHDQQSIFLCTEGSGLVYYDLSTKRYNVFLSDKNKPNSLIANNIKAAYYDKPNNELWLGTHLGGVCMLNTKKWEFSKLPNIRVQWPKANNVHAILPYKEDLLIATQNGLFVLDKKLQNFTLFSEKLHKVAKFIHDIKIDKYQNLWVATIDGMYKYNLQTEEIESFHYKIDIPNSLSNNNVTKIYIDSKDRIWIATSGGGINLYNEDHKAFKRYNKENYNLFNNHVSNISESGSGKLLIATTQGLSILDTEADKIYNWGVNNKFPLNSLYNGGMYVDKDKQLFIAGMNGLVSFYEENLLMPDNPKLKLRLVKLEINNTPISVGDGSGILKESLAYTDAINLDDKHKTIMIEFASDNYTLSKSPIYRYRLNENTSWAELPSGVRSLNFTNLKSGDYNLVIEGIHPDNLSTIASASLDLFISPPLYKTWYAYLFYITLIIIIISSYIRFTHSKLILENTLEKERIEKDHIEKVNQSKLRFFTNISHEFRTPLTLISGQIDLLLQTQNIQPSIYNRILSIKRNTNNMQNLANELLEFRKIEQGYLRLKVSKFNFAKFINEVYLSFLEYAKFRSINFNFDCQDDNIDLWFDNTQMQKVFSNIFSNAFKYTSKGGFISTLVRQDEKTVTVQIIDSGIGISTKDIQKIFERFYQIDNGEYQNTYSTGTGIGLALTKNILDLHTASIAVDSQLQFGTRFTITLQKGHEHFSSEQIVKSVDTDTVLIKELSKLDEEFIEEIITSEFKENQYTMLIVEDNQELCMMLRTIFEPIYQIYTAFDGEEGLELALKYQPDIVLSDLMLPKMSGAEMCSKIKNIFTTSHIPIVLLTAQTTLESNIEGLLLGADDYITKPFDVKALITRCNNLVNSRKILEEKFSRADKNASIQIATNENDKYFLEKAYETVEKHLDNSDFNILTFSREMKLGRTKFFHKIKSITGQTPNEFIISVRLKKATDLLNSNPEYSISEVSYKVGFTSPKYFSKCYKKYHGVSPSDLRSEE